MTIEILVLLVLIVVAVIVLYSKKIDKRWLESHDRELGELQHKLWALQSSIKADKEALKAFQDKLKESISAVSSLQNRGITMKNNVVDMQLYRNFFVALGNDPILSASNIIKQLDHEMSLINSSVEEEIHKQTEYNVNINMLQDQIFRLQIQANKLEKEIADLR